jgi:hypothetical protein
VLSAYTHLWNPIGFPTLRPDEGAYMRRAMHVLNGLGPQDPASRFDHSQDSTSSYDHPYFGQFFLAGIFKLIGYPSFILNIFSSSSSPPHPSPSPSTNTSSSSNVQRSIEMLYLVPRVLMGILAVVDTFLIYKICERRYNNKTIAFIASILFAVMPMTWILRLIVLDSIQLPFLLCSILFAIYYRYPIKRTDLVKENDIKKINSYNNDYALPKKSVMLILLSGIFLGLAIFTKIPAVTMIPLVGFLIYTNNKNNLKKIFALWFFPVILIPLIWPIYSITVGQFDEWLKGIVWQGTSRHGGRTLADVITSFFRIDPILLVFGIAGVVSSAVVGMRKNTDFLFFSLWLAPYLLLIYLVGWAIIFHLIVLLPAFCIAAARIIEYLVNRIVNDNRITEREKKELMYDTKRNVAVHRKLSLSSMLTLSSICVISVIAIFVIFGLTTTTILMKTNISFPQFEAAALVAYDVEHTNSNNNKNAANDDGSITIISSPIYSWIYNYVFHKLHVFSHDRDTQPIQTKKVILIVDGTYKRVLSKIEGEDEKQVRRLQMLYNNTETIAVFDDDTTRYVQTTYSNYYPYASMSENRIGGGGIEVRSNY